MLRQTQGWCRWMQRGMVGLLLLGSLSGCTLLLPRTATNPNLLLGNPSGATSDPTSANNYLIIRPQYALSYNRQKGTANWASWQLNQDWLGDLPRSSFQPDTSLPEGWFQVNTNDYTRSGFDRGHLVPAADRDRTQLDSQSVFLMTNIIPQAPDNNQGPWEDLESYCRQQVELGRELYIIAGTAGTGGIGERGRKTAIAQGKVTVPEFVWKVIVVTDRPGAGLDSITSSTRVIAVIMPNRQGIKQVSWKRYRRSVDQVESLTGYDLLSNLSPELQTALESKVENR